jgi:adenosylcobinamide-GDP ribazoletransferase
MTALAARELRAFLAALVFFSRLPVPARPLLDAADLRIAATWWPVVGLLVGGAMAAAWWLAAAVWPPGIAAGLALAAGVLVTGALEQDGAADLADGLAAGPGRDDMLAAMRESQLGATGMLCVLVLLGLRWQALLALPAALVPPVLVASQAASRAAAVGMMATLPYLRGPESRGAPVVGRLPTSRLAVAALTGLAPLALLPPLPALAALVGGGAALIACRTGLGRSLGGYTGDCVGATQQGCEIALLLAAAAVAAT